MNGGIVMKISRIRYMSGLIILLTTFIVQLIPSRAYAGSLDPTAAPGPTMRTLEEQKPAWNRVIPAAQRFNDALDGTAVLDKETGLVWAKAPDATQRAWQAAADYCADLALGGRKGWRLPTMEELASLIDTNASGGTKLPAGHPFQNIAADAFWSSTIYSGDGTYAWGVDMSSGSVSSSAKTGTLYVWPVRSGR